MVLVNANLFKRRPKQVEHKTDKPVHHDNHTTEASKKKAHHDSLRDLDDRCPCKPTEDCPVEERMCFYVTEPVAEHYKCPIKNFSRCCVSSSKGNMPVDSDETMVDEVIRAEVLITEINKKIMRIKANNDYFKKYLAKYHNSVKDKFDDLQSIINKMKLEIPK